MPKCTKKDCTVQALAAACAALDCPVPAAAVPLLHTYITQLMRYNAVMNLVGTRTWKDTLETLLADSFFLAEFCRTLPLPDSPLCVEAGAGAGLPGIPLRMVWQAGEYTLVEVRQKRALFMQTVLATLRLPRTKVYQGRIEDFTAGLAAPVDMLVSRAFMPWQQVLTLLRPCLAAQGLVVFLLLEPVPPVLPQGWRALGCTAYQVRSDPRFLWALQKQKDSK